jgi:alpha-L-rhamnosidase
LLRREFVLRGEVSRARVYATSHGLYQLRINGERVGQDELTPGFTSYNKRLQYQTYDVTHLLRSGTNAIGALLGEGWYAGVIGIGTEWSNRPHRYGDRLGLLLQLEATYREGTVHQVVTDTAWKSIAGPILMSGIYEGETYDARLEQPGWDQAGFDDSSWRSVTRAQAASGVLVPQCGPPARRMQTITPVSLRRSPTGETIADMGQNMVGWVRLSSQGPAGTVVSLRHGEALDADGNLYTANLGNAQQTVTYILKGGEPEVFEPHFTFQGFRYVGIEGFPGPLTPQNVTGVVVHSAYDRACEFETSSSLLNQLHRNIEWSQRGNFVDIPSDCPQRDERLGWTGDAQLFADSAAFNGHVASFFKKWLADLAVDQLETGSVPWVIPDVLGVIEGSPLEVLNGKPAAGAAGWGDAVSIIPWALYQAYNDPQFLQDQYESMRRWLDYQRQQAGDDLIWRVGFQFGDWAAFADGSTRSDLIATAYFAHSADLVGRAAQVLARDIDAARYTDLFHRIREAFIREFVNSDGSVGDATQTASVLALQFDLLPQSLRVAVARKLVENVRHHGHLTTGFLGTRWLLFALSEQGYLEDAYGLLLRQEYPSWLFSVTRGATTIWEQWNGIQPDGSFYHDPTNNSFNHYAYGAIGDWMHRVIAGINIDPANPGYRHIIMRPRPGGGLTRTSASHLTPYGRVSSRWNIEGSTFQIEVEIPANACATVVLVDTCREDLMEDGQPLALTNGITAIDDGGAGVAVRVGSGRYVFSHKRCDRERNVLR